MFNCKIRKAIRRLISFSLAACLLLGLVGCGSTGSSGSGKRVVTGKTPEETLETFFKALSRQDVNTMLACCYIEDYFDRVSFTEYVDLLQCYQPVGGVSAPAEYNYYRDLLIEQRRGRFSQYFQNLTFSLLATDNEEYERLVGHMIIAPADRAWAADFSRMVDPKGLKDIKVLSIDEDCPERQNDLQHKEKMSKNNGADDWVERTALLELNGALFYKGFTLVKVGERWQIFQPGAVLLGEDDGMGCATQIESNQAYRDLIQ